jgi:hypothetical protein
MVRSMVVRGCAAYASAVTLTSSEDDVAAREGKERLARRAAAAACA